MTKADDKILAGARDALAHAKGDKSKGVTHTILNADMDVKAIRNTTGLSQEEFASTYGLSLYTLRKWEHKTREPDVAAKAYLAVIETNPQAAEEAIRSRF